MAVHLHGRHTAVLDVQSHRLLEQPVPLREVIAQLLADQQPVNAQRGGEDFRSRPRLLDGAEPDRPEFAPPP
jgi:hypothetical protein